MNLPSFTRGDLLRIEWCDIHEDMVGNPNKAQLAKRRSYGLYWGQTVSHGKACLVTTTTEDEHTDGEGDQQGYCIYPLDCLLNVEPIATARVLSEWIKPETVH